LKDASLALTGVHTSPDLRVAVVTGGNRGIGLEICRQLASSGVLVVLTARDEDKGSRAVEELQSSGLPGVIFHQLDVADRSSIARLAEFVKTKFGKLDILVSTEYAQVSFLAQQLQVWIQTVSTLTVWVLQVNNAAIGGTTIDPERLQELQKQNPEASLLPANRLEVSLHFAKKKSAFDEICWINMFLQEDLRTFVDGYLGSLQQSYELAKECLDVNFNGTRDVTDCLIPLLLLSKSGRVVNITSQVAQLKVSFKPLTTKTVVLLSLDMCSKIQVSTTICAKIAPNISWQTRL